MNQFIRLLFCLALLGCAVALTGCQQLQKMSHELQPHRLHQLNRGSGMRPPSEAYGIRLNDPDENAFFIC